MSWTTAAIFVYITSPCRHRVDGGSVLSTAYLLLRQEHNWNTEGQGTDRACSSHTMLLEEASFFS